MASEISLNPIKTASLTLTIEGTSILVQHQWSEKAKTMMREKQSGKKTKTREVRNVREEAMAATYRTSKGEYGIPVTALKAAIIKAAHKDLGVAQTLVRRALFLICNDPGQILPIKTEEPIIREDMVRVGAGSADLRYRPQFAPGWECDVVVQYDVDMLTPTDIVNLINRAGFGVGLCEFRPEKGGDWGRFQVKRHRE